MAAVSDDSRFVKGLSPLVAAMGSSSYNGIFCVKIWA